MQYSHAFVIISFVLTNFVSCNRSHKTENKGVTDLIMKACLLSDIPSFDREARQIRHFPDSSLIFSYEKYTVYKSYKTENYYKANELVDTSEIEFVNENKYWNYFVYNRTEESGYYFDSISAPPRILKIDSFLNKNGPKLSLNNDFENYFSLLTSNVNGERMEKVFFAKKKNFGGSRDSLTLTFSKSVMGINYSISETINKKYGTSLSKMKMVLNSFYSEDAKMDIPVLEIFIELRRMEISNSESETIIQLVRKIQSLK